ncbi:MAG: hypothetical protein JO154_05725 [Chitinophaga sp.]|uniref:hypothetical protein n=1 Tax=Chitinophaga sp. TaxID=1869181 RepID=UPI0025BF22BC|nr:hypothetical protein [Chitinophaga sp.]MBV8252088.1 hypothetical protein [Chitinophaga sp.]
MKFNHRLTSIAIAMLLTGNVFAQQSPSAPKDRLGVSGPLQIGRGSYQLAWTSHPSNNYYKQEYLIPGENLQQFKHLVALEILTGNNSPKDIAAAKMAELNKLKATNPMVNYQVFEKNGEVLLDFLLTENTPDGKQVNIAERNIYRYTSITDKNGKPALLLLGVSERAYHKDVPTFLKQLKEHRMDLLNALAAYKLPAITISE